ncbi:TIGR04255 family protein [Sulfurimonas sp. NWX79]|uniref:TIGR04255 family protein n=1 Tax=Campylobacterales TaxID=213849 RepID=UPI003204DA87|nr:hypothetical protein IAPFLPAM_00058 [Sulfurimonas phage SNW-1]
MNKNTTDKTSILEAVVQFKFENKLEIEDVFFTVKTVLENFSYTKEQVMELPLAIRESDPKLKYVPYYKFTSDTLTINVSPFMLSFSINGFYPGWDRFKKMITENFVKFENLTSQWGKSTVSIRYIDFFQNTNIFNNISINVDNPHDLCDGFFKEERKNYVTEFSCKYNTKVRLQIVNNVTVKTEIDTQQNGSVIDTDVHILDALDYEEALEQVHEVAKETFFNILNDDFANDQNLKQ